MGAWIMVAGLIVTATYLIFDTTHAFYKASWLGARLYSEGRYFQALPYFLTAHRMNPDDKTVAWKLIGIYQQLGRDREARRVLKEINSRFPADLKVTESLGDMAYSSKAYDLAQGYYERVLARKPSVGLRKKYADTLLAEKKFGEAIEQIYILLSSAPDNQDLRFQHMQIISAAGDHERAVRELQALLEDGCRKKEAVTMLADELRLLGRDEEAIKIYQGVINEK